MILSIGCVVALHYKIGFVKEPFAMYRVHSGAMGIGINYAKLEQNALSSVINDPLVPNKNTVVERIYELYLPSAIYNWKNSRSAAKEDIKKYLMWSVRNYKIKNLLKVIELPYLFLKSRLL
jgi:ABC-type phosphate transport system substrate-binding protein